eukprot:scaffold65072_cov39-Prasinocladus_malaysianus.AAC.1
MDGSPCIGKRPHPGQFPAGPKCTARGRRMPGPDPQTGSTPRQAWPVTPRLLVWSRCRRHPKRYVPS